MRTSLALICSLALALIFVAFVCAFATTSDHPINPGKLAQSKSTQFARPTDDADAPLQPLVASIKPQTIKEVAPMLKLLMKYSFFFVLLHFFANVSWPPTVLGVLLVLTALFFPSSALPEASKGSVKLLGIDVSFQGGLRLAAIIAGIVLICGGLLPGVKSAKEALTIHEKA
jgi:hypothetical protein